MAWELFTRSFRFRNDPRLRIGGTQKILSAGWRVLKRHKSKIFREIKRNFWADDSLPKNYAGYYGHAAQLQRQKRRNAQRKLRHILEFVLYTSLWTTNWRHQPIRC